VARFGRTFAPGDEVMQIANDYYKDVYNGDIGFIDDLVRRGRIDASNPVSQPGSGDSEFKPSGARSRGVAAQRRWRSSGDWCSRSGAGPATAHCEVLGMRAGCNPHISNKNGERTITTFSRRLANQKSRLITL
jgi:hypothetical protein